MSNGVSADRLTKSYGDTKALIDLSFEVLPGCVYGMIGPNGAGKTTALSILAGLTRPDSGTATILGWMFDHSIASLLSGSGSARRNSGCSIT